MDSAERRGRTYTPEMAPERLERIRAWHEAAYQAVRAEGAGRQRFEYLGLSLEAPPTVQPITGMSELLGAAVLAEVRPGERVLDMGTGCGVNAILAARQGARVLAVDINPEAVQAAARNAGRNGVADRVEARQSDVFSAVDGRYDLIVFDPPFRWFAPRDLLEMATTDENYRALTEFFAHARDHLSEAGRMLVFFGTSGDLPYLRLLAARQRFRIEVLAHRELARDYTTVEYFTFRLTPQAGSAGE